MSFTRLGDVAPAGLVGARSQAHWAAQVIAAAGETHAEHLPDTSHTALVWAGRAPALLGHATLGTKGLRLGLRIPGLELWVVDGEGDVRESLPLAGETLDAAKAWAAEALARHDGALAGPLTAPVYDLPPHALGEGGRFEGDAEALAELAHWYADADLVLRRLAERTEGAGEVLAWPHHFDIATLVAVERDGSGEASKTIGIGLSPGDESFAEPYWYVNHWPVQSGADPGTLEAGEWYTTDWIGAVLRATELVAAGDAAAQEARLEAFLSSAVAASRKLLA